MVNTLKRASEDAKREFHRFPQKSAQLLPRTMATILALCTLLLLGACSTQNNIVNPSPAPGTWKIVHSPNPGSAQNNLNAIAATSATDAWAVGSFSTKHLGMQGAKALIEHWNGSVWSSVASPNIGTNTTTLTGAVLMPHSTRIWAIGTGATYGDPVSVTGLNGVGTTQETPVTAQTLIEVCCS